MIPALASPNSHRRSPYAEISSLDRPVFLWPIVESSILPHHSNQCLLCLGTPGVHLTHLGSLLLVLFPDLPRHFCRGS
jgi:hypothetical protein